MPRDVWTQRKLKTGSQYLLLHDEELAKAVERKQITVPSERMLPKKGENLFSILARSIVYQQLSGASASAIWNRLLKSSGDRHKLRAASVDQLSVEEMRSIGLSRQKSGYLQGLASEFVSGRLSDALLAKLTTDEVTKRLLSVRGIGPWTVNMFEIFHLGKQDVLPTGDLAVLRGLQRLYALDKAPSPKQAEALTQHWRPYRSLGSFYMWACF